MTWLGNQNVNSVPSVRFASPCPRRIVVDVLLVVKLPTNLTIRAISLNGTSLKKVKHVEINTNVVPKAKQQRKEMIHHQQANYARNVISKVLKVKQMKNVIQENLE